MNVLLVAFMTIMIFYDIFTVEAVSAAAYRDKIPQSSVSTIFIGLSAISSKWVWPRALAVVNADTL